MRARIEPSATGAPGASQISSQYNTAWFSTGYQSIMTVPYPLIFDRPPASMKKRNPPELFRPPQRPKYGGTATGACTLAYQVKGWSRSMRYVLSLMLAVSALGIIPASSGENELGVSLASLDNAITGGSNGNDRPDDGRNMALIKEGEFESPEMIAVIERNREDRERTVVIDR